MASPPKARAKKRTGAPTTKKGTRKGPSKKKVPPMKKRPPARRPSPPAKSPSKPAKVASKKRTAPAPKAPSRKPPARKVTKPARPPSRAAEARAKLARAKAAQSRKREAAREAEQSRVAALVRALRRSERARAAAKVEVQKKKVRAGKVPARNAQGRFLPKPLAPFPPRRRKHKPKQLRGPKGEFAPADTLGDDLHEFIQVWLPGWQRSDGGQGVAYSSLRDSAKKNSYLRRLRKGGDHRSQAWREIAEQIAAEAKVHVQEVYTLGLSP